MPYLENLEPTGPIQKGITYNVRPLIQPFIRRLRIDFICFGCIQLLVGPASLFNLLQIKVLSSTLATSLGWLKHAKQPGRFSALSLINVPFWTSFSHRYRYSSSEPSHQWISAASQCEAKPATNVSTCPFAGKET